jgi:hypothetical protein
MPRSDVHPGFCFNNLPLLDGCHPYRISILEALHDIISSTVASRSKTFFMRFDLHFPAGGSYPADNSVLTRFVNSFVSHLASHACSPEYLWVREWEEDPPASHQHYHFALLLDGNATWSPHAHLLLAERMWALSLGLPSAKGLVDYCNKDRYGDYRPNWVLIRRHDPGWRDEFAEAFRIASYLAKAGTKGNAPARVHEFGCSRTGGR